MVREHTRPQPESGAVRSRHRRDPVAHGPDRNRAGAGTPPGPRLATACGMCSASPISRMPAAALTSSMRWRMRSCATWAIGTRRRSACARGDRTNDSRSPRRRSNGRSAAASRTAPAGTSTSTKPTLTHPPRDAAGACVLFLRQGAGRGRPSDRHGRPGRLSPVGRDRFAGRGVSDDAPRLLGSADPLSQLSDPVAGVASRRCARSPRCSRDISCVRGSCWCRSASCSSRSCSARRRSCVWSSIGG